MNSPADVIVLSDEDDIEIESVVLPRQINPKTHSRSQNMKASSSSSSMKQRRAPILILTEPKSLSYGIERDYKLKCIHGLKRMKPDNTLFYLVEYEFCDDYEFVPSAILLQYCNENILIDYLEKLSQFND